MGTLAIAADSLGKRYRIGAAAKRSRTFKEALGNAATAPLTNLRRLRRLKAFHDGDDSDVIWAVRNVSFELRHGEVLGVIGRNGSGKSTLLKMLARITHPTTGRARVCGRVGSLLEVGTGFHPELTGRDNIYLNGSILGMGRASITEKFDQIVDFAGVATFIDTPVKRYSSGMYLRLAFAVAAHLEPDILIVDEVLAVGDAEFQQKCLRQIDEVAHQGRTVLFVSHNLGAIQRLCTRSVLLDHGHLVAEGGTASVIKQYLARTGSDAPANQWLDLSSSQRSGTGVSRFTAIRYEGLDPVTGFQPYPGAPMEISLRLSGSMVIPRVSIGFTLRDQLGTTLISGSTDASGVTSSLPGGPSTWVFHIVSLALRPGTYQLDLWVGDATGIHDHLEPALRLEVFDRQTRAWGPGHDPRYDGMVFCEYQVARVDADGELGSGRCGRTTVFPTSAEVGGRLPANVEASPR